MNAAMTRRSGCMSNMGMSIDTTQTDTSAFSHVALANQAFTQEAFLQPDCSSIPNYPEHGKVPYLQKTCAECLIPFSTNLSLEQHASSSGHTAFSCTCGAQFSRAYTLTRHINSMIGPSFPCELCDDKAFPRLDKLADHLRRWHRLGLKAFDQYRGGNSPPSSASRPTSGTPPFQAGALGKAYTVPPGFDPMSMFNGFPSDSNTAMDASLTQSSSSPDSSTGVDNWWNSQQSHNAAYPA